MRTRNVRGKLLTSVAVSLLAAGQLRAAYPYTTIATFPNFSPIGPSAGVILSGNTLYGTDIGGGQSGNGLIFSVPAAGGSQTALADLSTTTDGSYLALSYSPLLLTGNTLYGTTNTGGAVGSAREGAVFSVPVTGGPVTTLASFNGSNGTDVYSGLVISGNTL